MISGDIAYSVGLLRNLGGELAGLADVMDGRSSAVRYDADDVGHPAVHAALEEFADSWDDRRELLTRSLRSIGKMATESADTFEDVDQQLAAKIRDAVEERA